MLQEHRSCVCASMHAPMAHLVPGSCGLRPAVSGLWATLPRGAGLHLSPGAASGAREPAGCRKGREVLPAAWRPCLGAGRGNRERLHVRHLLRPSSLWQPGDRARGAAALPNRAASGAHLPSSSGAGTTLAAHGLGRLALGLCGGGRRKASSASSCSKTWLDRCGTSSVHFNLCQHPEIGFTQGPVLEASG